MFSRWLIGKAFVNKIRFLAHKHSDMVLNSMFLKTYMFFVGLLGPNQTRRGILTRDPVTPVLQRNVMIIFLNNSLKDMEKQKRIV